MAHEGFLFIDYILNLLRFNFGFANGLGPFGCFGF